MWHRRLAGENTGWKLLPIVALLFSIGSFATARAAEPLQTLSLDLRLRTGGAITGTLLDQDEHALVIQHNSTPYAFAWTELEPRSAYATRKTVLDWSRGGPEYLLAEDYFALGQLALNFDRNDLAATNFRTATRFDPAYQPQVDAAFRAFRERRKSTASRPTSPFRSAEPESTPQPPMLPGPPAGFADLPAFSAVDEVPPDVSAQVLDIYRTFGETARRVISKSIVLVETDHFLIWTDWDRRNHGRLSTWCEAMYAALIDQFQLDPAKPVFLAKCPVFAFRAKPRFREFAKLFDGFDARNSVGYTRSIEANGHVHVVLLRVGDTEADFDQFTVTLVHEGTHAFVHRLYATRLIPHWINEGLAEMTAERVLGDRCFTRETADLLARQFVNNDWPIGSLLGSVGPIEVYHYPLAHSVVAYLHNSNPAAFRSFIRELKSGQSVPDALANAFESLTLSQLESNWRTANTAPQP